MSYKVYVVPKDATSAERQLIATVDRVDESFMSQLRDFIEDTRDVHCYVEEQSDFDVCPADTAKIISVLEKQKIQCSGLEAAWYNKAVDDCIDEIKKQVDNPACSRCGGIHPDKVQALALAQAFDHSLLDKPITGDSL